MFSLLWLLLLLLLLLGHLYKIQENLRWRNCNVKLRQLWRVVSSGVCRANKKGYFLFFSLFIFFFSVTVVTVVVVTVILIIYSR